MSEIKINDTGFPSTSFIITCSALVFIMTPGVGIFYSGMTRAKNALSLVMLCYLTLCVVTIEWVIWGFSLAFSEDTTSSFIGNFAYSGLKSIGVEPLQIAPSIPAIVFCLYQLQFATVTASIIIGAVAERVRFLPTLIFIFWWTTFVYNPVSYWTWSLKGWLRNFSCLDNNEVCGIGSLDYAGGGPVHVASGFAGLAFCLFVGKRKVTDNQTFLPHNMVNVFIGTTLLWFGWLGFNGGSAITSTARAGISTFVTTLAASVGGLTWMTIDYIREGKLSGVALCSGILSGLVTITPASGYVEPWVSMIFGFLGAISCYLGVRVKYYFQFDDSLDAWGLHGVGGLVGSFLTGVFAQKQIATFDGSIIPGGLIDGNAIQIGYQLAGSVAIGAWSFCVSLIILYTINSIPRLHFRLSEEDETNGSDHIEMGEHAYKMIKEHN